MKEGDIIFYEKVDDVLDRLMQLQNWRYNQFIGLYHGGGYENFTTDGYESQKIGIEFRYEDVEFVNWLAKNEYIDWMVNGHSVSIKVRPKGEYLLKRGGFVKEYRESLTIKSNRFIGICALIVAIISMVITLFNNKSNTNTALNNVQSREILKYPSTFHNDTSIYHYENQDILPTVPCY